MVLFVAILVFLIDPFRFPTVDFVKRGSNEGDFHSTDFISVTKIRKKNDCNLIFLIWNADDTD